VELAAVNVVDQGLAVEALVLQPAPSRDDPLGHVGHVAVKFSGGLSAPFEGGHSTMVEAAQAVVAHVMARLAKALKVAPEPVAAPGAITVDELLARGVTADLEGRALDVVLRCGWPRPGDPLGIKPCIPIDVRKLKHLAEMIDAEDGRHAKSKLDELRTFIGEQLRMQRYVMALYVNVGEPELEALVAIPET
jgi:hypothetical protein